MKEGLKRYDIESCECISIVECANLVLGSMLFVPEENTKGNEYICCATRKKTIHVWKTKDGGLSLHTYSEVRHESFDSQINSMVLGTQKIWVAFQSGMVCAVDPKTMEVEDVMSIYSSAALSLALISSPYMLSTSAAAQISMWNSQTHEKVLEIRGYHNEPISKLITIWDKRDNHWWVWSCSSDKSLCVFAVGTSPTGNRATCDFVTWGRGRFVSLE